MSSRADARKHSPSGASGTAVVELVRCRSRMTGQRLRVRPAVDPFSIGADTNSAVRQCPESRALAARMAIVLGPRTQIVDDYLDVFSCAPREHLELLVANRTAIVFAPTIPLGLSAPHLDDRRGRRVYADEAARNERLYSRKSGTSAVYDFDLDALILPTSYASADRERVVLHELGHAVTYHLAVEGAAHRGYLLVDLPPKIAAHVAGYSHPDPEVEIANKVLEVLAEGFVYLVLGRAEELPRAVLSELMGMLTTVSSQRTRSVDLDIATLSGRTATRVPAEWLQSHDDAEHGHRFAPPTSSGASLTVTYLGDPSLLQAPARAWRPAA